jgi:hypothetical protein
MGRYKLIHRVTKIYFIRVIQLSILYAERWRNPHVTPMPRRAAADETGDPKR